MDEREFDEFYLASYRRLVGQLHALVGDRHEAEECVQEAFVRAWAHRRRLDRDGHPEAWVRTTAHRLAVSRWRRTAKRHPPLHSPTSTAAPDEQRLALVAALRRLPDEQRRALVLHHIADLSVREVARETGAPEGTVKARLARGRAALAVLLAEGSEGTSHA